MAGYSNRGAKVRAHRLLQRQAVLDEIERLRCVREKAVNLTLTGSTGSKELAEVQSWPLQVRRDVDAETAALLDRNYVIAGLYENAEICLGRRQVVVSKLVNQNGKLCIKDVPVFRLDPAGANQALRSLAKLLPDRIKDGIEGQDVMSPETRAVIEGFRAAAERYRQRTGQVVDIPPNPSQPEDRSSPGGR